VAQCGPLKCHQKVGKIGKSGKQTGTPLGADQLKIAEHKREKIRKKEAKNN